MNPPTKRLIMSGYYRTYVLGLIQISSYPRPDPEELWPFEILPQDCVKSGKTCLILNEKWKYEKFSKKIKKTKIDQISKFNPPTKQVSMWGYYRTYGLGLVKIS